jgi:hypothetical protein
LTPAAAVAAAGMGGSSVGAGVGGSGRGGGGSGDGGGHRQSIVINATIFLPISESTFVDANNPLLARY